MKFCKIKILIIILLLMNSFANADYDKLAYDFNFKSLEGNNMSLAEYKNKVIIVVNVASQCGFTKQYEDMQKIWDDYQNKGVVMLGLPSNDFGGQEPGTSDEIKNFCEAKFGITFPMTEKVVVKGVNAHPFYKWAQQNYGSAAVPKWNFHKIIIGKDGKIHDTFASITKPTAGRFIKSIQKALN